jgi:aspartate carbamoyltransferase catalytic subunit
MPLLTSVISSQQFDKPTIDTVFNTAREMEQEASPDLLKNKIMAALFYEPSTRTRLSFEIAMAKLGGEIVGTENAREFSSAAKGESLEDTIRTINQYQVDVIVLRYNKEGGAERAQSFSNVPVINAGDGPGQHPTQALLDLYTIKKRFGQVSGLNIALVGDLINGRTVRSLSYFLAKHYQVGRVYLVSPRQTRMRQDIKDYFNKYDLPWEEADRLDDILPELDVLYQTRVQKERFADDPKVYEEVMTAGERLNITMDTLARMKKEAIIMHPLPRVTEISYNVDKDPRAIYFEQAQNGLFIRMALLKLLLTG